MMDHDALLLAGRWRMLGRIGMFLFFCMVSSMAHSATMLACTGINGIGGPIGPNLAAITPLAKAFLADQLNAAGFPPMPNTFYAGGGYYQMLGLNTGRSGVVVFNINCNNLITVPTPPVVSVKLGKPSISACEAETGTISVTSNDPAPNGGTVTLTLPSGNPVSASFTGKTANLTFADFGLPNGYLDGGAHPAGSTLTFTADVTTAAGHSASASATANVSLSSRIWESITL